MPLGFQIWEFGSRVSDFGFRILASLDPRIVGSLDSRIPGFLGSGFLDPGLVNLGFLLFIIHFYVTKPLVGGTLKTGSTFIMQK